MARLVFILLILGLITWFYMGGTNKTVAEQGHEQRAARNAVPREKGQNRVPKIRDRLRKWRQSKRRQAAVLGIFSADLLGKFA